MADLVFSVASYNIHRCVGLDQRADPDRIVHVLRELDATIIGLQEVDSHPKELIESSQMHYIAGATGLRAVGGPTVIRSDSLYGNVLLTPYPVTHFTTLNLSVRRREPRGAIIATVDVHGTAFQVVVTHLGLRNSERRTQIKMLIESLNDDLPLILLGDINEWLPLSPSLFRLARHFGKVKAPRTFPSRFPILSLDRIWVRPRQALAKIHAHDSPTARIASDHLPLKAYIRLHIPPGD